MQFHEAELLVRPYSLVGQAGLMALWEQVKYIDREKIRGFLVECGVWRGGCCALMAAAHSDGRKPVREIHMFDSFAGLPPANFEKDGEKALELTGDCCGSPADVQEIMRAVVYPEGLVYCYPGWFNETLHLWPPGKIALLRLDADWYESTKICLDVLYQHIVPGGLLVIDDYFCWPGCRAAVDEYFENTNQAMIRYDDSKVLEGTTDSYVPATFIKEGRVGQRRNS